MYPFKYHKNNIEYHKNNKKNKKGKNIKNNKHTKHKNKIKNKWCTRKKKEKKER